MDFINKDFVTLYREEREDILKKLLNEKLKINACFIESCSIDYEINNMSPKQIEESIKKIEKITTKQVKNWVIFENWDIIDRPKIEINYFKLLFDFIRIVIYVFIVLLIILWILWLLIFWIKQLF